MDLGKKIHLGFLQGWGGGGILLLSCPWYHPDNVVGSFFGGVFINLPMCVLVCQVFETFGHIVISILHHYGLSAFLIIRCLFLESLPKACRCWWLRRWHVGAGVWASRGQSIHAHFQHLVVYTQCPEKDGVPHEGALYRNSEPPP